MATNQPSTCCGADPAPQPEESQVRQRYAAIARAALTSDGAAVVGCDDEREACGGSASGCGGSYDPADLAGLPEGAARTALGSGHPVRAAGLQPGETVVDLGCGGGIDVLLAAREVGPDGRAVGIDATAEMVALAERHAEEAGVGNAAFHHAPMERLPLADASVDAVVSNCVINLAADKAAVFAEIARVLRPGGRLVASDLVAEDGPSRAERGSHAGCVAGALSFAEHREGLEGAGMVDVDVTSEGVHTEGVHRALVRARAPRA